MIYSGYLCRMEAFFLQKKQVTSTLGHPSWEQLCLWIRSMAPTSANVAKNAARAVYGRILGVTALEWKELKGCKKAEHKQRKVAPAHDDI